MKIRQQGFALIESMIAVVVFAILLIALLNYIQYITLNFNQIYQGSVAIRTLHSSLEMHSKLAGEISPVKVVSANSDVQYPDWQIQAAYSPRAEHCTELIVSLFTRRQQFSLSRWFCTTGESHVSGLSF